MRLAILRVLWGKSPDCLLEIQLETSRNRAVSSARVAWGCSGGGFAGEEEGWAAGGSG
jgi:hypothetical protein